MLRRRQQFFVLLALTSLLWLAPLSARAAEAWPIPRGPSNEPNPFHYDAKLWKDVPKDFLEDAAACILYAGNTYVVEADGAIETTTHEVTRLNGRKAIEKMGEYRSITYTPAYQKITLNVACIHKADGRLVEIEPRHVQLRDVSTDFLVYDRDKMLIISFPSLEVGDVLEVKWTVRGKNPEHAGHFFSRYSFGDLTYPVVTDEFRVRLPKDKSFKFAAIGGKVDSDRTENGDQVTYKWKKTNIRQLPQDENLPEKDELRTAIACSTFPSWEAIGKWKQNLRVECWKCNEDIAKKVAEVTDGLTDETDKARALTYWLRRKIRYVSAGEGHDYTPHLPSQVFGNRYGDCKDTSQLLAVMLREAGIKVELATLGVYDDGQVIEDVPSPWGTHAILLVTIDGKPHWIDTTSSLSGWDFLPRDDHDRLCYVVDDKGAIRLTRTPPFTSADNRFEQTTHIWLSGDGSSRCEREVTSYGNAALGQRDLFLEVPAGERRRQVTSELQDANSRSRLLRLALDEAALRELDKPVTVRMAYEITGHFSGKTNLEGAVADSKIWGRFLAYNLDYDRKTPFQFYAPFESRHRYVVHVPAAYKLDSLPQDTTIKSKWGTFSLTVKVLPAVEAERQVDLEFTMRLEKSRVEPEDFDAFRDFHEDVDNHYRVWLTLKPVQELEDAPLLEAVRRLAPDDLATSTALARLYLRQHKEEAARRVLRQALAYASEDANLWELTVKAAPDQAGEEKAQRELTRLFPDNPRYSLGLGTILVQDGKYDQAIEVLKPLTEKGAPLTRALAHSQLARSCFEKKQYDEALAHLSSANTEDLESSNTVRNHLLLARIKETQGKFKDAVKACKLALVVEQDNEETLEMLIRLNLRIDDTNEALAYLRRYSVAVGDEVPGLLKAGEMYLLMHHYDEAFELANRVREQTFHEKAQRILGLVYLHRGDAVNAVKHLDKAEPDAVVLEAQLRGYLTLGNLREAEGVLQKAEKLEKPTDALRETAERVRHLMRRRTEVAKEVKIPAGKEASYAAALDAFVCAEQAHADGESSQKIETLLLPAVVEGVKLGPALGLRARLALEQGKFNRALPDAERALVLSPRDAAGYYVRGRVRLERRQDGAQSDLEKAAGLSQRKDAEILSYLADTYFQAGKREDAIKTQREAVQLRPKDKELAEQLAQFENATPEK